MNFIVNTIHNLCICMCNKNEVSRKLSPPLTLLAVCLICRSRWLVVVTNSLIQVCMHYLSHPDFTQSTLRWWHFFISVPVFQLSFKLLTENMITYDINNASLKSWTMTLLIMNAISSITTLLLACINV